MASAKGARYADMLGNQRLQENKNEVLGQLDTGYGLNDSYLGQAGSLYQGMEQQAQPGLDKYNALTLGSGEDIQRALEGSGGYQWNLGQGMQALTRARAAQGMLGSGNTDTDAMSFASGLASQTLGQERAALSPYFDMYNQGIGGQANVFGQRAGAATNFYDNRGSVIDNNNKAGIELTTNALKAGDAAKSANQAMMMQGATAGLGLLGSAFGGGGTGGAMGGFTKMLGFGK